MSAGSAVFTVCDRLSEWITEGELLPGAKVSETSVATRLAVSRNTVREAFRLLAHDGLLVHEFNRGVFVPHVTSADVRDVYRLRLVIEPQVVTGNMHFHRSLVALAGSPRLDVTMRRLMAELRLVFAVIDDPRALYEPFVARNRRLLEMLEAGRFTQGAKYLEGYLEDSEGRILAAFEDKERSA